MSFLTVYLTRKKTTVPRSRYNPKPRKPHKSTVAGLKYNRCYRCNGCGAIYTEKDCKLVFKEPKPTQCQCGSITFQHFHSTSEAKRYATLLLFQSRGKISNLRTQVHFPLYTINPHGLKQKVTTYILDFEYDDENGKRVCEEHKGGMTNIADLKIKWFEAQEGIKLLIT